MESTKKRIVYESLKLFSNKGFDGVSMREIAAAVGIKGASIYNHFKGKEELFQAIFEEMNEQYGVQASMLQIPMEAGEESSRMYAQISEETLVYTAEALFNFFTQNEFAVSFRKLMISEQHKSGLAAQYYKQYYLEAPIQFQGQIFENMQKLGKFVDTDAKLLAMYFYSPIFYLLCRYDMGLSYEDGLVWIRAHVKEFSNRFQ